MKQVDFRKDPEAYFWYFVATGDGNSCWLWTRATQNKGYGLMWWTDGKLWLVHRLAWMLTNGPIAKGLMVCHRCDNPLCVRPSHMFLGTQKDNMADMKAKLRERHPVPSSRKLTDDDVREIRRRHAAGERNADIARTMGMSPPPISRIVTGHAFRHVK